MRVILADDHQLVRAGLRALLQSFRDVEVLAECGDGHEALALVDRMQPDVLLLDVTLPGLNGLEVALRLGQPDGPLCRLGAAQGIGAARPAGEGEPGGKQGRLFAGNGLAFFDVRLLYLDSLHPESSCVGV